MALALFFLIQLVPETIARESLSLYEKSPMKAVLFSTLLPGGGQFYTERFLKGTLFLLGEGTLFYLARREKDKERRSDLIWWLLACHVFNMADAYVSAHLYKFNENKRISKNPSRSESK